MQKGESDVATKKEIVADIRSQCGNLITTKAVGKYLGLCPKSTREFMEGVPCYEVGRKRCYMAIDLANRIYSSET